MGKYRAENHRKIHLWTEFILQTNVSSTHDPWHSHQTFSTVLPHTTLVLLFGLTKTASLFADCFVVVWPLNSKPLITPPPRMAILWLFPFAVRRAFHLVLWLKFPGTPSIRRCVHIVALKPVPSDWRFLARGCELVFISYIAVTLFLHVHVILVSRLYNR